VGLSVFCEAPTSWLKVPVNTDELKKAWKIVEKADDSANLSGKNSRNTHLVALSIATNGSVKNFV
jgi:hypothetical protein